MKLKISTHYEKDDGVKKQKAKLCTKEGKY
jgi:hypothetical protein